MNKIEKNTQKTRGFKASTAKIRLGVMILFSLFLVGFASATFGTSLDTGIIAYYSADETVGVVIHDSVAFLHNATDNTTNIIGGDGKIGYGLDFTGVIKIATIPSNINVTNNMSLSFWANKTNSSDGILFSKRGGDDHFQVESYLQKLYFTIWEPAQVQCSTPFGFFSENEYIHVVVTYNNSYMAIWKNGVMNTTCANVGSMNYIQDKTTLGFVTGGKYYKGLLDEIGFWNKTLSSSEVSSLYNSGNGLAYATTDTSLLINLTSPENVTKINTIEYNFSVNLSMSGTNYSYSWDNVTFYIWYNNGTLFNTTFVDGLLTNETNTTKEIGNFTLGQYYWNSYACYSNATFGNCSWGDDGNYTFYLGASLNSLTYSNNTYETATENFFANFSVLESAEISLAQLVYNGTNYTITNLTQTGTSLLLQRSMDIPLNINGSANETKDFFFRFSYGGGVTQETSSYEQNVSFIKFIQCAAPYTRQSLNFTIYDEINQTDVPAVTENINIESNFKYWIGTGDIYKTYTFQNLSSTVGNYQFCIDPYFPDNYTFKVSSNIEYSADSYRENSYYMNNATLTNVSNDILLYTVHNDYASKFFLTFQRGTSFLGNAYVNVQKYFVGLDEYRTVAILNTDDNGDATMWQEVDKKYKYTLLDEDGIYIGTIYKTSICSVSPCALTLIIFDTIPSAFDIFNENYATGIVSNLSFSNDTKMVTYDFIDVTGLAHYFRLVVDNVKVGSGNTNVCDVYSYSAAGALTCNVTGYEGDFIANTYISRSPEKLDKVISFLIADDILSKLGLNGVFIILILIITLTIAAAVMSRGNPSVVIFVFGIAVLALKLIGFLPFGWVTVAAMEVLIVWIMIKLKT